MDKNKELELWEIIGRIESKLDILLDPNRGCQRVEKLERFVSRIKGGFWLITTTGAFISFTLLIINFLN